MFGMSYDEEWAENFVLELARGKMFFCLPDCLDGKTTLGEVEEFVKRVQDDQIFWIPSGLTFYGQKTWKKKILANSPSLV